MKKADYIKAFKEACQLARRHRDYPAPPAPTGNMLADMMSLEAWRTGAAKQAAAKHEEREKRFFENNPNFAPRFPRFGPGLAEAGGPGAGAVGAAGGTEVAAPGEPANDAGQASGPPKSVPKRYRLAHEFYERACKDQPNMVGKGQGRYPLALYEYAKNQWPQYAEETMWPTFGTWTRYLREHELLTNGPKNTPRSDRSSRNVVSSNSL